MSAPRGAALVGLGAHRPSRVVGNDEVAARCGSSDQWIRERTGIVTRGYADPDETVASMGAAAAAKALADAGCAPGEVDLLVLASCTLPTAIPGGGPEVAARLGLDRAGALDVNAGCAGFVYALALAADAVRAGSAERVLVVGSERLTDVLDLTDRNTAPLFGDGAGAVVVTASETDRVGRVAWVHDGGQAGTLRNEGSPARLLMEGRAVYRWATTTLPGLARTTLGNAGIGVDDLAAFVPHQANQRITDSVAKALELPASVAVADDIAASGNTSSASVPLAMSALRDSGRGRPGGPALVMGFGAGLTAAGLVVNLP